MKPWYPKRARAFLLRAAHDRAKGPGMSNTTLARIAGLQDPAAAESRRAFMLALTRAGWTRARIQTALAEVTRQPAFVRWARRQRWAPRTRRRSTAPSSARRR
jgi:hypothetical protein